MSNLVSENEISSLIERVDLRQFAAKKILITGGTGLVGAFMTTAIMQGCERIGVKLPKITVTSRSGNYHRLHQFSSNKSIQFLKTTSANDLPLTEQNIVIHAASPASPVKYLNNPEIEEANLGYMRRILKLNGLETVMFISSGEVYGPQAPNPIPETYSATIDSRGTRSAYPLAKVATERLLLSDSSSFFAKRIVRLFHTYGPGIALDDGRSFSDFIGKGAKYLPPSLHSRGEQIRTFSYLEDSIAGIFTVLFSNVELPVNVGSSHPISIINFAKIVSMESGLHGQIEYSAGSVSHITSPNDVIVPSTDLLQSLGWREHVPLNEGIRRTLKWIRYQTKL